MLNLVSDNKQCDISFQDGGHRYAVQLGALLGSQTQPASGMQSIIWSS